MKNVLIIIAGLLFSFTNCFAQCSDVKNNYELRLTPDANNTLRIDIRYNTSLNNNATDLLPQGNVMMSGLVFAITYPQTSKISMVETKGSTAPFALILDEAAKSQNTKTIGSDKVVTFYHDALGMGTPFNFDWKNDTWYNVATISYTGNLAEGDFFSLLNCDYGLANPNSYVGNSTTDPWFALQTVKGEFLQFSPKMTTVMSKLGKVNVFNVYPNPTSSDLNVNIESTVETQASIAVYDMNGRLIKNVVYSLQKGSNTTTISLKDLVAGTYSVKIADGKSVNYVTNITKL